ncbi:MAG: homoserine kinase [Terriglobales bacterium]
MPVKRHPTGEFALSLPASSANLGPAFDTAAIAWSRTLDVYAQPAAEFQVTAEGRDSARCAAMPNHLILDTYRELLRRNGTPMRPLALHLWNEIPVGKGCGSSAAARLAGAALASHFGQLHWPAQQVFEVAAGLEGHADNAAACWWGGLVAVRANQRESIAWTQLPCARSWPLLLVVPAEALATEASRRVLPDVYPRKDAIANLQNVALLLAAWQQGREDLITEAMMDHLHQPYRAELCPLLPALQPLAGQSGILGCALSGAGPSVLLVVRETQIAANAVRAVLAERSLTAEILEVQVAAQAPGQTWGAE